MKVINILFFVGSFIIFSNCETSVDCTANGNKSVNVSWSAPHARQITNVSGGGHRIYYSNEAGTVSTSSNFVDVPYSSSQTSGTIPNLKSGCSYYVRVQAYSALNPSGGGLSPETSIEIP